MRSLTVAIRSSARRVALASWPSTAAARCGRPIGSPSARRRSIPALSSSSPAAPQLVDHAVGTAGAVGAEAVERLEQRLVAVVDPVAEDVDVGCRLVADAQLDRGYEREVVLGRGPQRLLDAADRVVVGEREHPHPGRGGGRDDVARGQLAVGVDRVRLQVEGG